MTKMKQTSLACLQTAGKKPDVAVASSLERTRAVCRMTAFLLPAMWFKNLQIYRLTAPWTLTAEQLEESLAPQAFAPCSSIDLQTEGWVSPRPQRAGGMLVHTVNRQLLLQLDTEKKLLPS